MARSLKSFILGEHEATCKNWGWSWSFINDAEKFVIFGAWDTHYEGANDEKALILSDDWKIKKETGKRAYGFAQSKEHIGRIVNDGYALYIFKQRRKIVNGREKRVHYLEELSRRTLLQEGNEWYAVSIDAESMKAAFRAYLVGRKLEKPTVDTYCGLLELNQLPSYPDIQAKLGIASVYEITGIKQYQRLEPLLTELYEVMKDDKKKKGHESPSFNLAVASNNYKAFLFKIAESATLIPEEVVPRSTYVEGATKTITVNAYERDGKARKDCLLIYGYACKVCGFDFEQTYGEIGKEFIHVHHLIPLAEIKGEYQVDPENDLVPVCPNCHAMLHRETPPLEVDDLKERMKKR